MTQYIMSDYLPTVSVYYENIHCDQYWDDNGIGTGDLTM